MYSKETNYYNIYYPIVFRISKIKEIYNFRLNNQELFYNNYILTLKNLYEV